MKSSTKHTLIINNQQVNRPRPAKRDLTISASILDIDFCNLRRILQQLASINVDEIHYDVMDGHFVSTISFGDTILSSIARHTTIPLDVHLMVSDPVLHFRKYIPNAKVISFHFESVYYREISALLRDIHMQSKLASIVVNPKTNIEQIFEYCQDCDEILIMSVKPGRGGQTFIPATIAKIKKLALFLKRQNLLKQVVIAVDGGVTSA